MLTDTMIEEDCPEMHKNLNRCFSLKCSRLAVSIERGKTLMSQETRAMQMRLSAHYEISQPLSAPTNHMQQYYINIIRI